MTAMNKKMQTPTKRMHCKRRKILHYFCLPHAQHAMPLCLLDTVMASLNFQRITSVEQQPEADINQSQHQFQKLLRLRVQTLAVFLFCVVVSPTPSGCLRSTRS